MALWLLRVLVCSLLVHFVWCGLCDPAEEGKNYEMMHRARNMRHVHGFVWSVQYEDRRSEQVSYCYKDETCCWDLTGDFMPQWTHVGSEDIHVMTIEKVSPSHRGMKFIISALQGSTPNLTPIYECEVKVFKKPESAECYAEESGENHVDVTCVANESYPGMTCEMYQESRKLHDDNITHDKIAGVSDVQHKNTVLLVGDALYENTECTKRIFVPHVGRYKFYAKMKPRGMHPQDILTAQNSKMIEVTKPAVKATILEPEKPIDVCPWSSRSSHVTCEADGLIDNPDIHLYSKEFLDFHTCVLTFRETPNGLRYRKHCKVSIPPAISFFKFSTDSITVYCSAQCDGPNGKLVKKTSNQMKLRWPHKLTPHVRYEGKPIGNGDIIHVSQEAQTYISCTLEDKQEQSTTLEVICHDLNGKIAASTEKQNVSSIDLELPAFEGELQCECKAHHLTACHDDGISASSSVVFIGGQVSGGSSSCCFVIRLIAWCMVLLSFICC